MTCQKAGPTLNASTAQTLAEQTLALHPWNLDLNLQHSLVETKSETYLSGRTAHTLVYERNNVTFGSEGKMRVKVVVDGEVIREVTHFVKVPEAFSRKYEEMRAANIMLAFVAMMGALVFGMSALGAWGKLTADRWILSRPAFGVGFTLAFLLALNALGKLPLTWMVKKTTKLNHFITFYLNSIGGVHISNLILLIFNSEIRYIHSRFHIFGTIRAGCCCFTYFVRNSVGNNLVSQRRVDTQSLSDSHSIMEAAQNGSGFLI